MHFCSVLWNICNPFTVSTRAVCSTVRTAVLVLRKSPDTTNQITVIIDDLAFPVWSIPNKIPGVALDHFPNSLTGLILDQATIFGYREAIEVRKTGDGVLGLVGSSLCCLRKSLNTADQLATIIQDLAVIHNYSPSKDLRVAFCDAAKRAVFCTENLTILVNFKAAHACQGLVKTRGTGNLFCSPLGGLRRATQGLLRLTGESAGCI